ncbi:Uncharacterised protein [BD1-7 clade bacterium]|uniref:Phosphatidylinositol diacylglycerol-lyase n=1 Tax=BD1-7 clade bacterium TaxID=2029982 RepID=A0A5S9N493_9GAMM|nr:Uncharacterised protein [BD1-7 clade bacterium]
MPTGTHTPPQVGSTQLASIVTGQSSAVLYDTAKWMENFIHQQFDFKNRTLLDLILPGSHDAATYTMQSGMGASIIATLARIYTVTQTCTLIEQFNLGIRYFDIRITGASSSGKSHLKDLRFMHGSAKSAKGIVFPELHDFFNHIRSTNEVVLLKFHFGKPRDFELLVREFGDIFYIGSIESLKVITPEQLATMSMGDLLKAKKQFVVLTHHAGDESQPIHMQYKPSTSGAWAKTRDLERLHNHLQRVREEVSESEEKLKVYQTNQPGLVGSGRSTMFASVRHQDSKAASRNTIHRFVEESRDILIGAIRDPDHQAMARARASVRGVVSLDNIGSDNDKNILIQRIIGLNDENRLNREQGITRL